MASNTLKKPCAKCNKNASILTCDGCQQSFCAKHTADHRHDLSVEMDNIGQEYDLLRRDLTRDDNDSPLLFERIHAWENESIQRIQQIAKEARDELRRYLDKSKSHITLLSNKLTDELQTSRESGDYTETDFHLWIERLRELRKMLENPPAVDVLEDENIATAIRMIKVRDTTASHPFRLPAFYNPLARSPLLPASQTFAKFTGETVLSDDLLHATQAEHSHGSTIVYLTKSFSSGTSRMQFRIERKVSKFLFFGIIDSIEPMHRAVFNSPSLYGWMSPDMRVVKSRKVASGSIREVFREGDDVSITLNCDQHQLALEHHRTNAIDRLPIDLRACSTPWRVVVAFFAPGDSVRLLR